MYFLYCEVGLVDCPARPRLHSHQPCSGQAETYLPKVLIPTHIADFQLKNRNKFSNGYDENELELLEPVLRRPRPRSFASCPLADHDPPRLFRTI
jgi:hypothetical protein